MALEFTVWSTANKMTQSLFISILIIMVIPTILLFHFYWKIPSQWPLINQSKQTENNPSNEHHLFYLFHTISFFPSVL
jgi:hypothetical protein